MSKFKIADLIVEIDVQGERLKNQSGIYRIDDAAKTDCKINVDDDLRKEIANNPHLPPGDLEYILTNGVFFRELLRFNGVGLHASAVVYKNSAYLFSAPSGTGKSTHTQLWRQYFGEEKTFILNDDKPAIRQLDGKWFAFGTPWSGSTNLNVPKRVPLRGVAFLERSETNSIRQISPGEALFYFLNQTLRPYDEKSLATALDRTLALLKTVPIFILRCRPDLDAVRVAYAEMKDARPYDEIA